MSAEDDRIALAAGAPFKLDNNPLAIDEVPGASPQQQAAIDLRSDQGIRNRIAQAASMSPSVRQRTQSEILSANIWPGGIADPYSVRRVPWTAMREMTKDPTIGYAHFFISTSLIRAPTTYVTEDAQLGAAATAAFQPVASKQRLGALNTLFYGYQPMIKDWKLGQLVAKWRNADGPDPDEDLPVWPSQNVQALLPKPPIVLSAENILPRWDESGEWSGFLYSPFPLPQPQLIGVAGTWGASILSGYEIPKEWALWFINERSQNFDSLYGAPRTARSLKYWWSYWFRWALGDRMYEFKANPPTVVRYPTDEDMGVDSNDPNLATGDAPPKIHRLRQVALELGEGARSGAVLAIPGDFAMGNDGKLTDQYKWAISYLTGGENFELLDASFERLRTDLLRSMFLPESPFTEGGTSTKGGGGSSSRLMATQLGQIYQESQQLLADDYDEVHNQYELPQWVAANYPEKIGTPIRRVTMAMSSQDAQLVQQIITLAGQTKGFPLPVDMRELLSQQGFPLLSNKQYSALLKQVAETIAAEQPMQGGGAEPTAPTPTKGTQGYNAYVTKNELGEKVWVTPPGQIMLSESGAFLNSLPDIPPYQDKSVRSYAKALRNLMVTRYKGQIKSFADHLRDRSTLTLAQQQPQQQRQKRGLDKTAAGAAAAAIIAGWTSSQVADVPVTMTLLSGIISSIVARAGALSLSDVKLDPGVYDPTRAKSWVDGYSHTSLDFVDDTVRSELATFLTDELQRTTDPEAVAKAAEEHFEDLPQTHADRVARAGTRDAFNHGMLRAGIDAGITQVQAHDANDGADETTDQKCIDRNGQVMSPDDALGEREHPNGTLWFSYLDTDHFAVHLVDEFPVHLAVPPDTSAFYDEDAEILYVSSAHEGYRSRYALALGERLRMR